MLHSSQAAALRLASYHAWPSAGLMLTCMQAPGMARGPPLQVQAW